MLQADDNRCAGLQVLDDKDKELKLRKLFVLLLAYFRLNFLAVDAVMKVGCSD
jgi:hypothetical protein